MKKTLFLVAAASLVMTSCSNDEVLMTPEKQAISFDTFVNKTTRATDASTTNLTEMVVYGYIGDANPVKNFNGTIVSRANESQPWTYTPVQYWTAGKNYFFTAVASPNTQGNTHYSYQWASTLPTETANFKGTGTIGFDNSAAGGNEDVVYAFATKTTADPLNTDPGEVAFSFKHALSRVKFTFSNAMGSDAYSIKVYDLTINNATATAKLPLDVETPEWTGHANTTVLTLRDAYFQPSTQTALNGAKVVSGTKFIIPGTSTLTITFKVDLILKETNAVLASYNHNDTSLGEVTFQNGHSYNFVATINSDNINPDQQMFPIKFNVVDVENWQPDEDVNVTLPTTTQP